MLWHELVAYLIILIAAFVVVRRIYLKVKYPAHFHKCSSCQSDCKLRGMKHVKKSVKQQNCTLSSKKKC